MKVIIAIDESSHSKPVVDAALENKWPDNCRFKILTVLSPLNVSEDVAALGEYAQTLSEISARRHKIAQHLCDTVRHKLEAAFPSASVHYEIREGSPRVEIINAAIDWMADKIMVGAHGREVCPPDRLGSVSSAVAKHAPCSVEIVRCVQHKRKSPKQSTDLAKSR